MFVFVFFVRVRVSEGDGEGRWGEDCTRTEPHILHLIQLKTFVALLKLEASGLIGL